MEKHELERLAELNGIVAKSNDPRLRAELKLLLPKLLRLFFKAVIKPGDPPAWEDRTLHFMADMWCETDRGCVLVAVSHLDMLLTDLLGASLIDGSKVPGELLKPGRPLGEFMVRAKVSYGLGLISKAEYQDLETISQLRNARAHGIGSADFGDTQTLTLVSKLTLISSAHAAVTGRNRFIACVSTLVMLLEQHIARAARPTSRPNPDLAALGTLEALFGVLGKQELDRI